MALALSARNLGLTVSVTTAILASVALLQPALLETRVAPISAAVLMAYAACAALMPTRDSDRFASLAYALPFLSGVLVAAGPFAAALGAVLSQGVGLVFREAEEARRVTPVRYARSLLAAGIAVVFSGILVGLAVPRSLASFTAYLTVPLFIATAWLVVRLLDERLRQAAPDPDSFDAKTPPSRLDYGSLLLLTLSGIAAALLVRDNRAVLAVLLLLPLFMLRQAALARIRMYEEYYGTIAALCLMLQRAHPYTHGHLERVARIAEQVAVKLGLERQRARLIREAAVLHDIGKIAVDDAILDKPDKLDPDEMNHVRQHARFGAEILSPCPQFRQLVPWIRHHHERPDGSGYPDGLVDAQIPIESKIIAVVDAFDAMTGGDMGAHPRPYRQPMSIEEALAELERCAGSQFDARVVAAFRALVTEVGIA